MRTVSPVGWAGDPVRVEVPATSANLGPGFDCLGLALELSDTLEGEVVASGLQVDVDGEGSDDVARDESHLVVRAMRAYFEALGVHPPGLRLHCTNRIPHSRGMGSSSAAIVGGLVLARALAGVPGDGPQDGAEDGAEDGPDLLVLADRLEGHPDNVAPALRGGFTVAFRDGDEVRLLVRPLTGSAVLFVPPYGVRTEVARGLLPAAVTHAAASANTARAALLAATLAAAGRPTPALLAATRDYLHQDHRRPAMPESLGMVDELRTAGVPAVVSGAGPTVLAFVVDATGVPGAEQEQVRSLLGRTPAGWRGLVQSVGGPGARVLA